MPAENATETGCAPQAALLGDAPVQQLGKRQRVSHKAFNTPRSQKPKLNFDEV